MTFNDLFYNPEPARYHRRRSRSAHPLSSFFTSEDEDSHWRRPRAQRSVGPPRYIPRTDTRRARSERVNRAQPDSNRCRCARCLAEAERLRIPEMRRQTQVSTEAPRELSRRPAMRDLQQRPARIPEPPRQVTTSEAESSLGYTDTVSESESDVAMNQPELSEPDSCTEDSDWVDVGEQQWDMDRFGPSQGLHLSKSRSSKAFAPQPTSPTPIAVEEQSASSSSKAEEFKKGDTVWRKGRKATVLKVDYSVDPPSLLVVMEDTGGEVGTEVHLVSREPPQ